MRKLETYVNEERVDKTTDISKVIPFEILDSSCIENTILDPSVRKNGALFELDDPVKDIYGEMIHRIILPPIEPILQENCWILDDIQNKFNTVLKLYDEYHNIAPNKTEKRNKAKGKFENSVRSYLHNGLENSLWGKNGNFRKICISIRIPNTVRAVALPNANYALDQIGIPKRVMDACDKKHGDYILITRYPAIWDGSIEIFKAIACNSDCIEIHPLLCSQFNLDFDGDQLNGYWVPDTEECIKEAEENVIEFFKRNEASWPTELSMNGHSKSLYDPQDLDSLKAETKERLIPDGLSIDPLEFMNQEHNLDEIMGKDYAEDISKICKGVSPKDFYRRTIDLNVKNLTMKMYLGPVGSTSNDVKLVGSAGPDHVRKSAMYISEALQQSLMDSKHETGSPNNMRFMIIKNAISGLHESGTNVNKISKCVEENGLDITKTAPFLIYMYIFRPIRDTLDQIYLEANVEESKRNILDAYFDLLNNKQIDIKSCGEIVPAMKKEVAKYTKCSSTVFSEMLSKNTVTLNKYVIDNFPTYKLATNSVNRDCKDLSKRVLRLNEIDLYGCCAEEFSKFGD